MTFPHLYLKNIKYEEWQIKSQSCRLENMVVGFANSEKNECFEEAYLMTDIAERLKFYQNNFPSNGNMLVKKLILNIKT